MKKRCAWCEDTFSAYIDYHDKEWGVPVHDDRTQFEFILLEGAQAGLSWATILKKRGGYRKAFAEFDPQKVARFDEQKIQALLQNDDIIRNELKIRSAISNAQHFIEIQEKYGSFADYIWRFLDGRPIQNRWKSPQKVPAKTDISATLAKDLKDWGFKFVGPTIIYSHMQATGMVNDHVVDCFRHQQIEDFH